MATVDFGSNDEFIPTDDEMEFPTYRPSLCTPRHSERRHGTAMSCPNGALNAATEESWSRSGAVGPGLLALPLPMVFGWPSFPLSMATGHGNPGAIVLASSGGPGFPVDIAFAAGSTPQLDTPPLEDNSMSREIREEEDWIAWNERYRLLSRRPLYTHPVDRAMYDDLASVGSGELFDSSSDDSLFSDSDSSVGDQLNEDDFMLPEALLSLCPEVICPDDSTATCSICLEGYGEQRSVRGITECGHHFHSACLERWLRRREICPNCRGKVAPHR
mmetsp:Transcript_64247/g.139791  ORF Transcript_64247/g.139791 Transcript_64247/m.139791 type:complete len:274 (-) Transcript_64247:368-1189(-)